MDISNYFPIDIYYTPLPNYPASIMAQEATTKEITQFVGKQLTSLRNSIRLIVTESLADYLLKYDRIQKDEESVEEKLKQDSTCAIQRRLFYKVTVAMRILKNIQQVCVKNAPSQPDNSTRSARKLSDAKLCDNSSFSLLPLITELSHQLTLHHNDTKSSQQGKLTKSTL